ncbi:MAG: DUF3857 domain-containing protein [Elusimicrobia bacterium]|nr:DUF3857 domain-containing protein [Elusimicrobiota bacterium]
MRFAAVISVLFILPPVCRAEVLTLRSGQESTGTVTTVDADSVTLEDGKVLPRETVSVIQFGPAKAEQKAAAGTAQPSEQDQKAAAEAFAMAREFGKKYSGMNGLILLDKGGYNLNADGTWTLRTREIRQILKESLKQSWGQIIRCSEEGRERAKIIKANVYTADGGIYTLDPARIKTSKPQSSSGDFFISGSVCTQYAMENVQVDSIVDYEIEEETYNPFRKDFFFPEWGFQDSEGPVKVSEVSVTLPKGQDFYYSTRNFADKKAAKPEITQSVSAKTYAWRLENVPALPSEPMMPAYENVAPYLRGSLFKDWDRILDWTIGLYNERTKPSTELKEFTLNLIKDCKTDEEKARVIYHYVQKEIRYIAVKVGVASGWGGYDANLTWKRRYGCCVDKSLLLTTMLGVAGIKASPILINTNDQQDIDFSIPQLGFDHSITVAEIGGRHMFLDSTGYDYRYPEIASFDYGVHVLNIFAKKIDLVPVPEPRDNGSFYNFNIAVSSDGKALVSENMNYSGSREGEIRGYYRSIKEEEQKRAFQQMAKEVNPAAELVGYKVNNAENINEPFTLETKYSIADYAKRAGDILIFNLPDFEIEAYRIKEISQAERTFPIEYMASMGRYYTYHISLPENYEVISLPEKAALSGSYGSFTSQCAQEVKGGVTCTASWERGERIVKPADYAAYKAFLETAASRTKNQLFFKDLSVKIH